MTSVVAPKTVVEEEIAPTKKKMAEIEFGTKKCHPECSGSQCTKMETPGAQDNVAKTVDTSTDADGIVSGADTKLVTGNALAKEGSKVDVNKNELQKDVIKSETTNKDEKDGKTVDKPVQIREHGYHRIPYDRSNVSLRKNVDITGKSIPMPLLAGVDDPSVSVQRKSTVLETADTRKMEKSDMQNLNSRLATFIEKVRYLEAYNKALIDEIEKLRNSKAGTGTKLREMYEEELNLSRKALEDTMGQLSSADVTILDLMEQVKDAKQENEDIKKIEDELRKKNEKLITEVGDYQGEVTRLADKCEQLEGEVTENRALTRRLQDANVASKSDLDAETMRHLEAENRAKDLETQLNFVTAIYEQEIAELKDLLNDRRGDAEVKDYWQGELSKAVGDIQREYDQRLDHITRDMEGKLSLQMQTMREAAATSNSSAPYVKEELSKQKTKMATQSSQIMNLQSENARLRANVEVLTHQLDEVDGEMESDKARMGSEIKKLQNELETVLFELQTLMNAKLSMQMEIATYKKLLEHEETRVDELPEERSSIEEPVVCLQPEVTVQKQAMGDLVFNEATVDGRYVSIKNRTKDTKAKPMHLKGWSIYRVSDGGKKIVYTFGDVKITPLETIKVWGKGSDSKNRNLKDGLVADFESWGTGNSETFLCNCDKQDEASIRLTIN